jgi:acetylornithine deacetylase/succinyl-diaminopimelate desuccinylase-like protein
MSKMVSLVALAAMVAASPAAAAPQTSHEQTVAAIRASDGLQGALDHLKQTHDRFVADVIRITEVPAPPFKEAERAKLVRTMFADLGYEDAAIDAEGNVTALRPGTDPDAKLVVVSAHLDTVFPEGTDVKVRREGDRLYAPGIGDDSRGLATLLAFARALDAAKIRTRHGVLFVATVGEEGRGNLRGVRHLFTEGAYKDRIGSFFSLDGSAPARVTHGAVGSKRYRVTFKGPGGHSYGAFGIVNPMAAMSLAVTELYKIQPPQEPKTTYAASVTGGGRSINAIPDTVFMDFDMRSRDPRALAALEKSFLTILDAAAAAENKARSTKVGTITVDPELVGDRPAGETPREADIVRYTEAAVRAAGFTPQLNASSTDSNIPMSLGIPAVTISPGAEGERAHSLDEYVEIGRDATLKGMTGGLVAILATAGMEVR